MSQTQARFAAGDVVAHPRRPEWGSGVVKQAQAITHEGQDAQRLAVDFANQGRVVINTAIAPLTRADSARSGQDSDHKGSEDMTRLLGSTATGTSRTQGSNAGTGSSGGGWLAQLERASGQSRHELWGLPHAMTDPFETLTKRLEATLDSYKFSTEPRSLIDWAVIQTGLNDPLSKYTRSELEQAFPRFARDRDEHLKDLVRQIKRKGDATVLQSMLRTAKTPAAINGLQRAMRA